MTIYPPRGTETPQAINHDVTACRGSAVVLEREGYPHEAQELLAAADDAESIELAIVPISAERGGGSTTGRGHRENR